MSILSPFVLSGILRAFKDTAIGSRVTDSAGFLAALGLALEAYDTSGDRAEGQHFIVLGEDVYHTVSSGEGKRSENRDDYILRNRRGRVVTYLKRQHAAPLVSLAAVVYTVDAYLSDPEISEIPGEVDRIRTAAEAGATHVIVAVIAAAAPRAPRTPYRFLKALAGGNKEADAWTLEEVRTKATESIEYWDEWAVVAD